MNVSNRGCIRRLSLRSLLANRTRNLVAVLAIALTATLFTSLFTIALSINEGIQQNNFRQAGGWSHSTFKYLTEEQFEAHKDAIQDPVCRKRAKHAVYENQRTIRAVDALKANDIETFGRLMNETHISLRDDFEVSCAETDLLAELAWQVPGVLGSRITGGGFGGCTVSIVKNESVDLFIQSLDRPYEEKTGHKAEFYVVDVGDGAHALD